MEVLTDASVVQDDKGQVEDPFKRMRFNSELIVKIKAPVHSDSGLLAKIFEGNYIFKNLSPEEVHDLDQQRQKKQAELISQLYTISLKLEPRGQHIKPKSMGQYETLMIPAELDSRLHNLIKYFRHTKFKVDALVNECQKLISTYGFAKFEESFDTILTSGEFTKESKQAALKVISRQIMSLKFQTFTALITESGKIYASNIVDTQNKPDDFFLEEAQKAAEKYTARLEKDLKNARDNAQQEIKKVSERSKTDAEKKEAIEKIEQELVKQIKMIQDKTKVPYQIEAARRDKLISFSKDLLQRCQLVNNYVVSDILSRTSIDARTITLERYVLLAEKMIASGNLDTAFHIYGGLTRSGIIRLKATIESLSDHAKQQLDSMGELFAYEGNYKALKKCCEQKGVHSPLNLNVTDIQFTLDGNPFSLDEEGKIKASVSSLRAMDTVKSNCEKAIAGITLEQETNDELVTDIYTTQKRFSGKKDDEIQTMIYEESLRVEPRDTSLMSASKVVLKLTGIMRSGLYESAQQEKQERKWSLLEKFKTLIDTVKSHWHSANEDESQSSVEKVKSEALIEKVTDFVDKLKQTLLHKMATRNDEVKLQDLSEEQLTVHLDQLVGDLLDYHLKHGGDLEYLANFKDLRKDGYEGIEGQKRFYSADVLIRLQTVMQTGFQVDTGKEIYNYLYRFAKISFINNSNVVNELVGKEPTLVRMVREQILPAMEELAHRKGWEFVSKKTADQYQCASKAHTPSSSSFFHQKVHEGRKTNQSDDEGEGETPTTHMD